MAIEAKIEDIDLDVSATRDGELDVEMRCSYREEGKAWPATQCGWYMIPEDFMTLKLGELADPKTWAHKHYERSPYGQQSDRFLKVVKGRAKVDGDRHGAEITCSRDIETLIMRWIDGELVTQEYILEPPWTQDDSIPTPKLHFDPAELTDSELVRTIRGMPVRWWNTIAGAEERAVVGQKVTVEHIFRENGDEDESKRIVKFIDHSGGGFRAFHVSALLKVG